MDGYVQDRTCDVVHCDLHNGASWLGQQLVILCSPLMKWLNEFLKLWKIYDVLDNRNTKKSSHSGHHPIAFIGEGSQNEQNFSSGWFNVAILLI
jgi:hypothetical protein